MADGTILTEWRLLLLRHGQRIRWCCAVRPSRSLLSQTPRALSPLFSAMDSSKRARGLPRTRRPPEAYRFVDAAAEREWHGPSEHHSGAGVEREWRGRGPLRAPLGRRRGPPPTGVWAFLAQVVATAGYGVRMRLQRSDRCGVSWSW
jgi:hypothetical protein